MPAAPRAPETEAPREMYPGVIGDPRFVHGQPVIAGTRVPVAIIVGHVAAGDTASDVALAYGLTLDSSICGARLCGGSRRQGARVWVPHQHLASQAHPPEVGDRAALHSGAFW